MTYAARPHRLPTNRLLTMGVAFLAAACAPGEAPLDVLLVNGKVLDGTGNPWFFRDIGIAGDRIAFVGDAELEGVAARDTLDVAGFLVTPGFWDVHSHADPDTETGRAALPQLTQGITTVVLGMDGRGASNVAEIFAGYRANGIAVNVVRFVGHGSARGSVLGMANRAPTPEELDRMKAYVQRGMEEGAAGLSTGLYYTPGTFATTDEVVELARVAARYGGLYDTHDRDLGVAYKGVGYLGSIREAIEIAERAGLPAIFSHFNAQGPANYGKAPQGARLIEEARARGVNVMAGQHVYDASGCSLVACTLPRWAAEGGEDSMKARLADPEVRRRLRPEVTELLGMVGGPTKLRFTDRRPELFGRTLAQVAAERRQPAVETILELVASGGNASVINHDIYDPNNTDFLAQQDWMMTCTDGGTPEFGEGMVHPRTYGAFPRKLRQFVYDRPIVRLPFAVRGMTSLAATFYQHPDRGLIKEGVYADLVVLDEARIGDRATYDQPHQYSEGVVHVLVNGQVALRNGQATGVRAGRPLPRRTGGPADSRTGGGAP
ncbi:MAG TPA: amidohydrolase family protein [Gemmatimonadales bacterium]|nr:amidohydrolase family protein [Gemmatimonadales bacterium]